jgi:hypothetical protein
MSEITVVTPDDKPKRKTRVVVGRKTPKQAAAEAAAKASEPTVVEPKPSKRKRPIKGLDAHGFRENSDSALIVSIMLAGGVDRQEINEKVRAALSQEPYSLYTRGGKEKNIPSLISGLLSRLAEQGYVERSEWKLVAPKRGPKR